MVNFISKITWSEQLHQFRWSGLYGLIVMFSRCSLDAEKTYSGQAA